MSRWWVEVIIIGHSFQLNSHLASHIKGFANGDEPMMEFDPCESPFRKEDVARKFELRIGDVDVLTGLGIEINREVVKR